CTISSTSRQRSRVATAPASCTRLPTIFTAMPSSATRGSPARADRMRSATYCGGSGVWVIVDDHAVEAVDRRAGDEEVVRAGERQQAEQAARASARATDQVAPVDR